ncbi:hypothetical protein J6590_010815 [Homalodisca vitripennis]|nr:hypothetical protein J6590_100495 [Homalodisca vitripennis]KAG8293821.1 hypothetical protein J6590_010815 [Homalodisca vitripennis]
MIIKKRETSCSASIKTDVNLTSVTADNQTSEHPVAKGSLLSPLPRSVALPGSSEPTRRHQHPQLSTPRQALTLLFTPHHRPRAMTTPTVVTLAGSLPCAAADAPVPPTPTRTPCRKSSSQSEDL